MKKLSKKVLCVISSAVLLCGATAIPASAERIKNPEFQTTLSPKFSLPEFVLNKTSFNITSSETAYLEVGYLSAKILHGKKVFTILSETEKSKLNFQWYNSNGIIRGATDSIYPTNKAGKYYCRVSIKGVKGTQQFKNNFETNVATVNVLEELEITKQPVGGTITSPDGEYNLSVEVKGGKGPYQYKWYMGSECVGTGASINVDKSGYYFCIITDSAGREVVSNVVSVGKFLLTKDLTNLVNMEFETQKEKFDVAVTGGTGRYQYIWQYADIGADNWRTISKSAATSVTTNSKELLLKSYLNKQVRCQINTLDARGNVVATVKSGATNITEPIKHEWVDWFMVDNDTWYQREKITGGFGKYTFSGYRQGSNGGALYMAFDEETGILTYDGTNEEYRIKICDEVGNTLSIQPIF